jgi:DNA invertase Pin-like site-specific DNA recombinase
MSKSPSRRRAYSYIRFSSAQQAEGGSFLRQIELSRAYCKRKGLDFDESLSLQDLGVSAFRGDNVREGALAGFLEACRVGRVPRGSVLIVESLDRFSRDQIRPALQLFLGLQDFGITIVTLQPEREYPPDATDALALIEPLIVFARAHEESAMKSHRRRDGWRQARDRARQGGGPMLKTCPAWLVVTGDGFRVKEEEAATVRRIFAWARDGLGVHRITERLRSEGVPPLVLTRRRKDPETGKLVAVPGRWVKAFVYKILASPAATGTYQPMRQEGKKAVPDGAAIAGFYPEIVTEEEWREAQASLRSRGGGFEKGNVSPAAGRKGAQEANLFTGLLFDARSGERMHLVHGFGRKGAGERRRYVYLTPTRETGVPAGGPRMDYAVFERAVLSRLRELRPADVTGDKEHAGGREADIARLSGRLLDIDSRLERAKQRARAARDFDVFLDLIEELQAERKHVSERLAELQTERDDRQTADLGEAHSLIDLHDRTPPEQREDLRRRLKVRIRQLVSEVRVLTVPHGRSRVCAVQVRFRGSKRRRDYLILHEPGKSFGATRSEGRWWAKSWSQVVADGDLDLRKQAHARKLEEALTHVDVTVLTEGKEFS